MKAIITAIQAFLLVTLVGCSTIAQETNQQTKVIETQETNQELIDELF